MKDKDRVDRVDKVRVKAIPGRLIPRLLPSLALLVLLAGSLVTAPAQAQSRVKITTPLGSFTIELYDSQTPGTVRNFLNYVNSGRYNNSFIHRSVPGFVIQGGGYNLPEGSNELGLVETDGTIANEPGLSNLRGTVAMAKVQDQPDSATSQWFVNLDDNTFLDTSNGGFTVFGRVIGDGMTVVDAIMALQIVSLSNNPNISDLPVINYVQGSNLRRENLVLITAEQVMAPNRFDNGSGLLILRIDARPLGIAELAFAVETREGGGVDIRGLLETLVLLSSVEEGYATLDEAGQLTVPELEVDGAIAFRNLVFTLADAAQLLFTLQSYE